jgi:acid phosphatase (class A)
MRRMRVSAVVLAFTLAAISLGAKSVYLQPEDIDVSSILSGPPADDSPEHQAEVATLLQWQNRRTAQDVARCQSEAEVNPFVFAEVLGDWFKQESFPITDQLLTQANVDAKNIDNVAKKKWDRVRPPLADSRIHPCVPLEKSGSYPSGHATRGVVWATLLSQIYPDQKDALMARGKLIGEDRVIAGMHYPSDVEAGQKLGAEIAAKLLANPDFQAHLDQAKLECARHSPKP